MALLRVHAPSSPRLTRWHAANVDARTHVWALGVVLYEFVVRCALARLIAQEHDTPPKVAGHVMVTQGLRLGERRRFETVVDYIDTITSLDPDFREPFRLADTLTTMQAKSATIEDVRAARLILEKGVARFPNDAELWLNLGGFVTWIAPTSYLTDPEEQRRWRIEGAGYLGRAAELGSEDANLAWQAIGGARALVRAGERDASIRFYRRALATTRDEGLRSEILKLLGALEGQEAVDAQRARQARLESVWRESYPAWTLTALQLSPPPFDVARCAGGSAAPLSEAPLCARTWRNWTQRVDAEIRSEHLARPPSIGEPTTQPAPRIP